MKLNVIKWRGLWWAISASLLVMSAIAIGLSLVQFNAPIRSGLDFIGGTRLQLALTCAAAETCTPEQAIDVAQVRDLLADQGLSGSSIQVVEDYTLSVRTQTLDVDKRTELQNLLSEELGEFDPQLTQIDTVGPTIGQELFTAGLLALIISFFGIIVYLSFRFQFDYAVFAILALFHDVAITAGIFAILGLTTGNEIDSLFLVALLTIIGFSVNDTVVIYDRIRETNANREPGVDFDDIVDQAVNQTLTRSINTSVTTTLPLIAIFLFGGDTLKFFALALIVGFILGAYSSIFIASTLLAKWRERQEMSRGVAIATDPSIDEAS
ncbi:MAG: protein translocase subunit SecF [Spirulinaceae cyanobacterium SM2_1_0]|nr:protein translocase subunit SecF [Spirulinaceae cyanobacterium SM2_1_0]